MTFGHLRKQRVEANTEKEAESGAETEVEEMTTLVTPQGSAMPLTQEDKPADHEAESDQPKSPKRPDVKALTHTAASPNALPDPSSSKGVQAALHELDELSTLQERRLGITGRVPESLKDNLEAFLLTNKRRIGRKPSADLLVETWISLTLHDEDVQRKVLLMLRERLAK